MKHVLLLLIATSSCTSLMGMAEQKQITPILPANSTAARMENIESTHNSTTQATTSNNRIGYCDRICCGAIAACVLCPNFTAAVAWDTAHIISDRKENKCYPHTKEIAKLCYCFMH